MKKRLFRIIALILAVASVAALTGCTSTTPAAVTGTAPTSQTEETSRTEPTAPQETKPALDTAPVARPTPTVQNRYDTFVPDEITVNNSDYVIPEAAANDLIGVTNYAHYKYYDTAFYVLDLGSKMSFGYNADRYFSPGCTRKAGMALAWFKQCENNRLNNEAGAPLAAGETRLTLASTYYYDGSDYLAGAGKVGRSGYKWYTIDELLYHLLHESDNTAYKALWNTMGIDKYNALEMKLGIPDHPTDYKNDKLWTPMRPLDLGLIWQEIWNYKGTGSPEAQTMWKYLTNNLYCEIGKVVKDADVIAHKAGSDDYGFHEAGIVVRGDNAYVVVAMSTVPLPIANDNYDCIHMVIERIDPIMQHFYTWQAKNNTAD